MKKLIHLVLVLVILASGCQSTGGRGGLDAEDSLETIRVADSMIESALRSDTSAISIHSSDTAGLKAAAVPEEKAP